MCLGNHINNVENRNKWVKFFLKNHRGGGSNSEECLARNLGELLFLAWYSPRGEQQAYYDILMFIFSTWVCFGFKHVELTDEFDLPDWLLKVRTHIVVVKKEK